MTTIVGINHQIFMQEQMRYRSMIYKRFLEKYKQRMLNFIKKTLLNLKMHRN
jgi:alpha-galactosidase/6-phospho-beta-glucosidase family protein